MILGIDPGPVESGWCLLCGDEVDSGGQEDNSDLLRRLSSCQSELLAIETMTGAYQAAIGLDVIQTAIWIGRFAERWDCTRHPECRALLIPRKTIVTHLTGYSQGGNAQVRQALIDLWGGNAVALARAARCVVCRGNGWRGRGKTQLCTACDGAGRVGEDGPLRGVASHQWSALAVAVTARDGVGA